MGMMRNTGLAILTLLEKFRLAFGGEGSHWLSRWKDNDALPESDFMLDADSIIAQQEPIRARILMRAVFVSIFCLLFGQA